MRENSREFHARKSLSLSSLHMFLCVLAAIVSIASYNSLESLKIKSSSCWEFSLGISIRLELLSTELRFYSEEHSELRSNVCMFIIKCYQFVFKYDEFEDD